MPKPGHKDPEGSQAWADDGIAQLGLRDIRDEVGDQLVVMADLCLDEYTDHGHCGLLAADGTVDNDATVELYARVAVAQAEAGADVVAPSGMMDGQVAAIRAALDGSGHDQTAIMAYAAKFASAYYGPFRDAVDVTHRRRRRPQGLPAGRRQPPARRWPRWPSTWPRAPTSSWSSRRSPYLDVVAAVRARFDVPVAAYHVSGEYSMIKAAAERGWIDGPAVALEQLVAVKRAGADIIVTYFAGRAAERC